MRFSVLPLFLLVCSAQNHSFSVTKKEVSIETVRFPCCLRRKRHVRTKDMRWGVVIHLCKSSEAQDEGFLVPLPGRLLDCSILQSIRWSLRLGNNLFNFIKMSFLIVQPSNLFLNGVTQSVTALIIFYGWACFFWEKSSFLFLEWDEFCSGSICSCHL